MGEWMTWINEQLSSRTRGFTLFRPIAVGSLDQRC